MSVLAPVLSKEELDAIELKAGAVNRVRELAQHYLIPDKVIDEREKSSPEFVRKMSNAASAVEVVCSLVNTFGVMRKVKNYSNETAIADLVFALNTNTFWIQNAAYLMPLMNAAVNSILDSKMQGLENQPLWKELEYHNKNTWLELLPAIVFCLRGYSDMRKVSLEMKKAFEPLLGV